MFWYFFISFCNLILSKILEKRLGKVLKVTENERDQIAKRNDLIKMDKKRACCLFCPLIHIVSFIIFIIFIFIKKDKFEKISKEALSELLKGNNF